LPRSLKSLEASGTILDDCADTAAPAAGAGGLRTPPAVPPCAAGRRAPPLVTQAVLLVV